MLETINQSGAVFNRVTAMTPPALLSALPVVANAATPARHSARWAWLPGLALALALAGGATALHRLPWLDALSPAALAILLGIALRRAVNLSPALRPGLTMATHALLRGAVILLGLQLTFGQIAALGFGTVGVVLGALIVTLVTTVWVGRRLGVEPKLARLIATGTSICGASAVVAANSVTRGSDEDVAYALAIVTVLGTVAMFAMPALVPVLGLAPDQAGVWLGASIYEVAQVVGAATGLGEHTTAIATVAKMTRVLTLAPIVLAMAAIARHGVRRKGGDAVRAQVKMPWFVFGFLALAGVASLGVLPRPAIHEAGLVSTFLLAAALGAMGFGIDLRALHRMGARPMILAIFAWLLLSSLSLGLALLVA